MREATVPRSVLEHAAQCTSEERIALLRDVTERRDVYVYGELFGVQAVQAVRRDTDQMAQTEHAWYRVLTLFATGTWSDYEHGDYLPLSDAQEAKLRKLTLVSWAQRESVLGYDVLLRALGLDATDPNAVRQLEDYVFDAIHDGVVTGHLDGLRRVWYVSAVHSRDVPRAHATHDGHDAVARLATQLHAWAARADTALAMLEQECATLQQRDADEAHQAQQRHDALVHGLADARTALTTATEETATDAATRRPKRGRA